MRRILGLATLLVAAANLQAVTVTLDYTYDQDYFSKNLIAKATLMKAASDLSDALNSASATLNAASSELKGTDVARSTEATFDWSLKVTNPSDPNSDTKILIPNFSLGADVFQVFVGGSTALAGPDALGEAAPATADYKLGYFESPDTAATKSAILAAVDYSNGILLRGAGPIITSLNDAAEVAPGDQTDFTVKIGPLASFLSFDVNASWNFDYTKNPGAGEFDFYTVMLHEMMHGLGFGSSETWRSKVDGANWSGLHVIALMGAGNGLINESLNGKPDGAHIAANMMSKTLVDDTDQEAVMTATLSKGQRRKLTKLDLAFLQDLGYGPALPAPTPPLPLIVATPTPTPAPTPVPGPPAQPILAGKSKIKTTKSKIQLGGSLIAPGAYVQYKIGSGPFLKAKGGQSWTIKLKLKKGKNIVTIQSFDPATGKTSSPKKIVITRS